ncbi:MAG: type II secretion system F family protein [Candidatus Microgenomates bacterium]|jgi:type IV pilus assembly protein PilC
MKKYFYQARDKNGKLVKGEVDASSESHAAKLIRKQGLIVIIIKPVSGNPLDLLKKFNERITTSDVTIFTRQLSIMVNAGLPITDALMIMKTQTKGQMQKVVINILTDIEEGESLSSAIAKYPDIFSPSYIALLKSGEAGGVMDEVLLRLTENLEKQGEFAGKVKGALVYPMILVVGMVIVAAVMVTFVIPKMMGMYTDMGAKLPLPTQILLGISGFAAKFWWLVLMVIGAGVYGFIGYRKTAAGKRKIDELILKIPIIGDLERQILLTDLTRSLSLMVGSGVSILDGLNITAGVMSNTVISDALLDAAKQVEKGFPIAYSFGRHPEAFPFILSQMLAIGEETGKTEEVLKKLSHIFEIESDEKVKNLTTAIEPAMMIILGVGVAFLFIAVIMPIYTITNSF